LKGETKPSLTGILKNTQIGRDVHQKRRIVPVVTVSFKANMITRSKNDDILEERKKYVDAIHSPKGSPGNKFSMFTA